MEISPELYLRSQKVEFSVIFFISLLTLLINWKAVPFNEAYDNQWVRDRTFIIVISGFFLLTTTWNFILYFRWCWVIVFDYFFFFKYSRVVMNDLSTLFMHLTWYACTYTYFHGQNIRGFFFYRVKCVELFVKFRLWLIIQQARDDQVRQLKFKDRCLWLNYIFFFIQVLFAYI